MPKHVFFDLFHATTMLNTTKEMTKNVFNNLMINPINKNHKKYHNRMGPIILLAKFSLNNLI
jgi:ribulose 1,5-bisphosphate synthetase/thiazole synthase